MSYIGGSPVLNSSEFREEFAITSTTTTINTNGFNSSTVEVFKNGVFLSPEGDYTLGSDAATITLTNSLINGDIIVVTGRRELVQGVLVLEKKQEFIISGTPTTVTFANPPLISDSTQVFINGVLQQSTTIGSATRDYTVTNATTGLITFTSALTAGDIVTVITREPSVSEDISEVTNHKDIAVDITVSTTTNKAFFGPNTFSGTINVLQGGTLINAHGAMNLTGTLNLSGTLNVV